MSICKGIAKDVQKQAEMMNVRVSDEAVEAITQETERFVAGIIRESTEICSQNKRKIVTSEDIKQAVYRRGIEIFYPLFDEEI